MYRRLKELKLPEVEFKNASFSECFKWFKAQGIPLEIEKSRWVYVDGKWVCHPVAMALGIDPDTVPNHLGLSPDLERRPIDISMRNVTAAQALKLFAHATDTSLIWRKESVAMHSPLFGCHGAISVWKVPRAFFEKGPALIESEFYEDCKTHFESRQVKFSQGESALYSQESEKLILRCLGSESFEKIYELLLEFEP